MNRLSQLCSLACGLTLAASASAALVVQMDVDIHIEPAAGSSNVPPDSHVSNTVTLGDKRFVVTNAGETTVYDFATRKRDVIDRKTNTRVEYSLYDVAGFRVFEFDNRTRLNQVLAAAKVTEGAMGAVDNEHVLAIQKTPSAPLQVTSDAVARSYAIPAHLLARTTLQSTPVKADDARMFAQVVRYTAGGHPQMLADLAASQAIPAQVVLKTYDIGVRTVTLTVRAVQAGGDVPLDTSRIAIRAAGSASDPIDRALDRAAARTPADHEAALRRGTDEIAAAFRDGRVLDAYLGSLEWLLTNGEGLPALTDAQREMFKTDPLAIRLGSALGVKNRADAAAAITTLESLRPTTTKGYVLDLFIANDQKTLGNVVVARDLFVKVLDANPEISGVYKDLGDALVMAYDTPRAWRSWDTGRRLAPKFANFRAVDQLEGSLVSGHPEYF